MLLTKINPLRRLLSVLLALILVSLFGSTAQAQTVTRGYSSDSVLQRGMIVGLTKDNDEKVEPVGVQNVSNILGVVVSQNDSPITLSSDDQKVFVATAGVYDVFVSDQLGQIKTGDYVTASSLAGIGMKADDGPEQILGRAIGSFDGRTKVISSTSLQDTNNQNRLVNIGRIQVEITVGKNPLTQDSGAPAFLNKVGTLIAGKSVSPLRLYLGALIFLVGTVIAGAIMYAGIRSSIIAIGRNPLSKRSIIRSLIGVGFTSFLVFIVCLLGVYLLLKL
jgi:hypothetical protein